MTHEQQAANDYLDFFRDVFRNPLVRKLQFLWGQDGYEFTTVNNNLPTFYPLMDSQELADRALRDLEKSGFISIDGRSILLLEKLGED